MARQSEATAPTIIPKIVDSPTPLGAADRQIQVASKLDNTAAEVVKWGNGEAESVSVLDKTEEARAVANGDKPAPSKDPKPEDKPKAKATETPKPEETPPDDDDQTPVDKPKPGAARRAELLATLEAERQRVDVENRIKAEQTRAEKAEKAMSEFNRLPLGAKLAIIAKDAGMTVEDLKDKLLIGAEDVTATDVPADKKAEAKEDPKVAELLRWKADREAREAQQQIETAVGGIREQLKDTDLPLIDTFDAYDRVLTSAFDAWKAEGKSKPMTDYVQDAAAIVEEALKNERPSAAARLYKQREEAAEAEPTEEEASKPKAQPKPAMGRRVAAKQPVAAKPLPMDPYERDQEIKRRMGWT